jgi:hypothetical protein
MSPLPGWRLVWSLYGRLWCRSSLEGLSVAPGRAGMWSRAMWRGQPSHQPDHQRHRVLRSTTSRTGIKRPQARQPLMYSRNGYRVVPNRWIIGQRNCGRAIHAERAAMRSRGTRSATAPMASAPSSLTRRPSLPLPRMRAEALRRAP